MTEQYVYSAIMTFDNTSKQESIELSMDEIQLLVIDKDYENTNMPVITLSVLMETKVRDRLILEMDDGIVSLQIIKYNKIDDDFIGQTILNDIFVYIIDGEITHSQDIDYKEGVSEQNPTRISTTMYLMKRDSINNNRQIINCVNRYDTRKGVMNKISMTDLVMRTSSYLKPMLLEPIENNKSFDEVIIPPMTSVSEYIKYLNDNISTLYSTGYRFFMDFDTNYIVSKSGIKVEHKDQKYPTVIIDIGDKSNLNYAVDGNIYNAKNRFYHIPVSTSMVKFHRNVTAKHLVTQVACIDSSGNVVSDRVYDSTKNIHDKMSILTNTTSNTTICKNAKNELINGSLLIDIVKSDLDASIFTINKEYIINNVDEYKEYDGRYLLCGVKQFFIKDDVYFMMNTALRFKKISQ